MPLLILMYYSMSASWYVGFHDALGFLYDAKYHFAFTTNATNHFFYNALLHALVQVFSFVNPVAILTSVSIICSGITLALLYRYIVKLGYHPGLGLICIYILGLSFTYWQQSGMIEVYSFNNMIFLLYTGWIMLDWGRREHKFLFPVVIIAALGMLTHIQHVLSIPALVIYIWSNKESVVWKKVAASFLFLLISSFLLVPPLIFNKHTVSAIFFEQQFKGNVIGFSLIGLGKGILKSIGYWLYNFHLWTIPMIIGYVKLYKHNRRRWSILNIFLLPYLGFAVKYNVTDNHVFFLVPYLLMIFFVVEGFKFLIERWRPQLWPIKLLVAMIPFALYLSVVPLAKKVPQLAELDKKKEYKGGLAYFLSPFHRFHAEDPLAITKESIKSGKKPEHAEEWRYDVAVEYLKKSRPYLFRNEEEKP